MNIKSLFFPCRCPFCDRVIETTKPCCDNCTKYIDIPPHRCELLNGCTCISAFPHEGIHRKAVLAYKYHGRKQLHIQFSIILSKIISSCFGDIKFDCYTSAPPHKTKFAQKQIDRVKLIAKETARLDKVSYMPLLRQTTETALQHNLQYEEKIQNVKGTIKCIKGNTVRDKTILIFDDVVTSGATLSECSDELLKNGAKNVFCVTINW